LAEPKQDAVEVQVDPVSLKGTVTFERKVNLGSYESCTAAMFVQFDYASNTSESELIQKGRDAFFVAKSVVFEQLGIDAVLEDSGIVVELVKQSFPGTTAEVVAGAPITPVDPVAADGTTVSADPPADKTALKAWALARFASHPQEFFDNRPKKAAGEYNPKSPDLKHKATGKGIWFS